MQVIFSLEYSVFSVITATVLGFIAGCNLTWTSPEFGYLNSTDTGPFNGTLTDAQTSWISGVMSLGAALGPFIFGYLAEKIGRKWTILTVSMPFVISSVLCAFSRVVEEFYVARFITGISIGGTFTILPMYVGEMSLDEHRGVLGSVMNVFLCFGLLFTYVVGALVSKVLIFNLILASLTIAFFVLFLFMGVETPHYYVMKNKHDLAKGALLRIRKQSDQETEKELDHIRTIIEGEEQGNLLDIFRNKGSVKAFIIGSGLVFFQQASGINAVLFFAQNIFQDAGSTLKANYCSMIIGAVQFGTSFITPLVSNLFGRKTLLILSGVGMCLSESVLGIYDILKDSDADKVSSLSFLPIISLVLYIITYNVGYGPLPWAIVAEIFPSSIRSAAGSLVTFICWITSFFITKWFKELSQDLGQGQCFLGFAVFSLVAAAFVQFFVIETKGKTLKEIQDDLNN
ncbi:facilitated trehalose transporter Tret1-like isoform X1 [Sitophilus oryzae]|uniref:Facilitated trehalose transporter Tret1-like isoform X1 n=1 Tax=Sitophilus oryzae TaxID=7048 RepID=A0A6J2YCR4_SITOR|nr:facilitated trehalose transporter Tret1-like isoform X1 [Sitophilus oryzae]